MGTTRDSMTIGEAARRLGVTTKTVRYYEQIGLLPHPSRTDSGYRRYGEDELVRLRFIGKAKSLGLSLEEIARILALSAEGGDPCPHVVGLLDQHLARIGETLARLADFREQLARLRAEAERATKGRVCGIIEHARVEWVRLALARPLARRTGRRSPSGGA